MSPLLSLMPDPSLASLPLCKSQHKPQYYDQHNHDHHRHHHHQKQHHEEHQQHHQYHNQLLTVHHNNPLGTSAHNSAINVPGHSPNSNARNSDSKLACEAPPARKAQAPRKKTPNKRPTPELRLPETKYRRWRRY